MVEALRYKPKGRGSISDEPTKFFNWPIPSSRTMTAGSTESLNRSEYQEFFSG
jgi:hypothetical protein